MIKTKLIKLEDFIEAETKKNKGKPPKLMGSHGFKMDLTLENYKKIQEICRHHNLKQEKN